jgi:adenosylcobyric acid synthase
MKGALLVAGTGSDVGKSVVVQGLCRWLVRRGASVAPFKAQNMSLNSYVTLDGAEIARAQAAQAAAASVAPEAAMNPILLKPMDDRRAQVIVMGKAVGDSDAQEYMDLRPRLAGVVREAFEDLRSRFDVVVCEGAGSLAEINLREGDLPNLGLARAAGMPVVIVADIDRGGVFASLYGSVELLDEDDRALVAGFIINKFRGRFSILEPGLAMIEARTGRPVLGVLPWVRDLWTDAEDALPARSIHAAARPPLGRDTLDVAVVALRRMSNFTDADAIACEPGITVRFTRSFADLSRADLVILPGTKATVEDLVELRADGLDDALAERANRGLPILGICGGYQMLGTRIVDDYESGSGETAALGLLPVETIFGPDKVLARPRGIAPGFDGAAVGGYEIHNGRVRRNGGDAFFETAGGDEGCRAGVVVGTSWHGVFESDAFRVAFLRWVASTRGLDWTPGSTRFADIREATFDTLADMIERYLDTSAILGVIERGAVPLGKVRG